MPEAFAISLSAARSKVLEPATVAIEKALITDVMMLREGASLLTTVEDYQDAYNRDGAVFYAQMLFRATAFFQQLHATVALAAWRILDERGLDAGESIAAVRRGGEHDPALSTLLDRHATDIRLLEHLCRVRNHAFQHRAGHGLHLSNAIVLSDGFVVVRGQPKIDEPLALRARALLKGLKRQYGVKIADTTGGAETLAYLELIGYQLRESSPAQFRSVLDLIECSKAYLGVISVPMLDVVDRALARLIDLVPNTPRP